ncbi:hypothetical protein I3843_07G085900 [Carya illinoinensis]|nr:hypothetical protein I3843_07G085900 [Carya illinoinensis]
MEDISSDTSEEQWYQERPIKEKLFRMAMEGKWDEVAKLYEKHEWAQTAKITNSGDTALHIAVSVGKEDNVRQLIKSIRDPSRLPVVLQTGNDQGNTPLHSAASMGNVAMCQCIATVYPELVITTYNNNKETPLFMAALHGKKAAFFCLHSICAKVKTSGDQFHRRKNGDTILHCAIAGTTSVSNLAFQIIHLYPHLASSVNEEELTPLHILASRPSAFRSGSHLEGYDKIIYYWKNRNGEETEIKIERKDREETDAENPGPEAGRLRLGVEQNFEREPSESSDALPSKQSMRRISPGNEETPAYPENYRTCNDVFKLLWKMVLVGVDELFPANYRTCIEFVKLANKALLMFLGLGLTAITKIENSKQKHTWAVQILNELLNLHSTYEDASTSGGDHAQSRTMEGDQTMPYNLAELMSSAPSTDSIKATGIDDQDKPPEMPNKETPLLLAAKNGIAEIVERILEAYPFAVNDVNEDNKNIVLLAVEYRQPKVYEVLLRPRYISNESMFRKLDKEDNSALHLAAKLGERNKPLWISSAALQMQWENNWYEYIRDSVPLNFFPRYNKKGKTPSDLFTETHIELVKEGSEWLKNTAQSCSVITALIATVAFATSATVPGGFKGDSGIPALQTKPEFDLFAISSLLALSFSIISLVMFLSIITSRYQERDFGKILPRKLLIGLTSMILSIAAILISFCAGHFFVLRKELRSVAVPMYVITFMSILFFTLTQFSLFFDVLGVTFKKVPQRK